MKTLLLPVDSSGIPENALRYIAGFAADRNVERIILLKSAYVSVYAELLPSADFVQMSAEDIGDEREKAEQQLTALANKLTRFFTTPIPVIPAINELPLLQAIREVAAEEQPHMMVLGVDKTMFENDSHAAEQIIAIAKTSAVPVLIVPECARFEKIELALVPCDFAAMTQLEALQGIKDREKWLHPRLMVLNTNFKKQVSENDSVVNNGLAELLADYEYAVFQSEDKDIVNGILGFARAHHPQWIISLPGRYSFFYNLTHRSITNALALNATRPVLILK